MNSGLLTVLQPYLQPGLVILFLEIVLSGKWIFPELSQVFQVTANLCILFYLPDATFILISRILTDIGWGWHPFKVLFTLVYQSAFLSESPYPLCCIDKIVSKIPKVLPVSAICCCITNYFKGQHPIRPHVIS